MRVFLDTNVLFSGLRSPRGPSGQVLLAAADRRIDAVVSNVVTRELSRNILEKMPELLSAVGYFLAMARVEVAGDPLEAESLRLDDLGFGSDAAIVAAAVQAEGDSFCTGDRRLLAHIRRHLPGLQAVSPAELARDLGLTR